MIKMQQLIKSGEIHGSKYDRRKPAWQPMSTCPFDDEDRLYAVMVKWSDGSERPDVVKGVMWIHGQPDEDSEDQRPIIWSGDYRFPAFAWMPLPGLPEGR
jgi:hypothetical protein